VASNTPRLNLYKKDPVADANDTFNIQTMLNDNWDRIDQNAETIAGAQAKVNQAEQNAKTYADQQLATHLDDTAAHGIGDKSALLTNNKNTIVEAINELFTFANDGKNSIASVIGSPATSGDTFTTLASHIQNAKNTMATNLTAKGTAASGTDALQALADKIANVSTGKKWASGLTSADSSGKLIVTGLSFAPSYVVFWRNNTSTSFVGCLRSPSISFGSTTPLWGGFIQISSGGSANYGILSNPANTSELHSSGFVVHHLNLANLPLNWVAIE
jgi:hypothetical protein